MSEQIQVALKEALERPNLVAFVVLFLCGFFVMTTNSNMIKKLIGIYLLQTSVLLLLVTIGVKQDASVPILIADHTESSETIVPADYYVNPLPHVLTLTAIVVQVATLGVSLALVAAIYRKYGSLDENEVLQKIE